MLQLDKQKKLKLSFFLYLNLLKGRVFYSFLNGQLAYYHLLTKRLQTYCQKYYRRYNLIDKSVGSGGKLPSFKF